MVGLQGFDSEGFVLEFEDLYSQDVVSGTGDVFVIRFQASEILESCVIGLCTFGSL